ncbi:uncharacterized protein F5147DRAFT_656619 [Suillus discolor]|uniref:Uncharacterized protein n=1 Tax=Suillus discolor TaxID=1912936 RepID=A0A9P7JPM4_9AGAM|nr:uncharacterized protein F5147DRAFT_656619 [Suillus discolor]KAG2096304.1 hypothetical protein F5147DRAFT_656619 [Suillus discolor]
MSSDDSHGVPRHPGISKPRVWAVEDAALPPVAFNVQCSKYFTLEEKNTALRKQIILKDRTAARRIQNAHAKAKLRRWKRTTTGSLSNAKPLPQSLVTLAVLPLPNSSLFHQACSGSELIDESDVLQWEKPPPYDSPPPPNSPDEDRFTRNLVDVMHGRQYRLEKETRARYAQIFATANAEVILQDIQVAERTLMGKWNELNEVVKDIG